MQAYKKFDIPVAEIIPTAQRMRAEGRQLVMIHGYLDTEGKSVISYDYEVGSCVESYTVTGETVLPTISGIYSAAAEWPERELHELMGMNFTGLDTSNRLFLADSMLDGQGHIIVTPMEELREKNIK
jgi:NADH:ubiquinone oxidoreductase subunit C